ncbi:hypothetical protein GXU05_004979 [Escherichia coli]|nr:hypothetical protein [Escherichia coli]EFI4237829.1 hypothetical protein [Escherichia coli]EFI9871683.1 hypothetical protein [Escherichia coli]EFJ0062416.1 hypothetical protein [Escherichia coli]
MRSVDTGIGENCPGNDSGLILVLIRCQPVWLLAWLISCRQAFNSRLQVSLTKRR